MTGDTLKTFNVIESPHVVMRTQFRMPKSKRRRIRKKWAARAQNWMVKPDPSVYVIDNALLGRPTIVGHPATIGRLRYEAREE
jgi:hypothetical protein